MRILPIQPRHFEAITYSAKAAVSAVASALVYKFFDLPGAPWVAAMAAGVMFTGLVCYLLKLDDLLRPAFVAVVLVTLIGGTDKWHSSLNLAAAVVIGCLCALAAGFLFDKLSNRFKL